MFKVTTSEEANEAISAAMEFIGGSIERNLQAYDSISEFVFGHAKVGMLRAIENDNQCLFLVNCEETPISQQELADKVSNGAPSVCLRFINRAGIDALMKNLEYIRREIPSE